jgi:hypothetical protein
MTLSRFHIDCSISNSFIILAQGVFKRDGGFAAPEPVSSLGVVKSTVSSKPSGSCNSKTIGGLKLSVTVAVDPLRKVVTQVSSNSVTFSSDTVDGKSKPVSAKNIVEDLDEDEDDGLMFEDDGVGGDNDFEYDDEYY